MNRDDSLSCLCSASSQADQLKPVVISPAVAKDHVSPQVGLGISSRAVLNGQIARLLLASNYLVTILSPLTQLYLLVHSAFRRTTCSSNGRDSIRHCCSIQAFEHSK